MTWLEMMRMARRLKKLGLEPFLNAYSIVAVHTKVTCMAPCPIHAPSNHKMKNFRLRWRGDRRLMERECEHGTGHPDPDDLAFKRRTMTPSEYRAKAYEAHGCDGCCQL